MAKFLGFFPSFIANKKEVYKFKLPKKQKNYNVFYIFLLEYNIIKKEQIDKKVENPKKNLEFNNNKKYKMVKIKDSIIYIKEAEN